MQKWGCWDFVFFFCMQPLVNHYWYRSLMVFTLAKPQFCLKTDKKWQRSSNASVPCRWCLMALKVTFSTSSHFQNVLGLDNNMDKQHTFAIYQRVPKWCLLNSGWFVCDCYKQLGLFTYLCIHFWWQFTWYASNVQDFWKIKIVRIAQILDDLSVNIARDWVNRLYLHHKVSCLVWLLTSCWWKQAAMIQDSSQWPLGQIRNDTCQGNPWQAIAETGATDPYENANFNVLFSNPSWGLGSAVALTNGEIL